jgi:hypothetical protein
VLNLRLLCQAHNLLHARKCFGSRHIATKIAATKSRDSRYGRDNEASLGVSRAIKTPNPTHTSR